MGGCTAVWIAATVWVGLAVGRELPPFWISGFAVAAVGLAWLARRAPDRLGTLALVLAVLCGSLARGGAAGAVPGAASGRLSPEPPATWMSARVVDHPARESGDVVAILETTRACELLPRGARVRLRLPAGTRAEWGDTLRVLARVEAPSLARVPGVPSQREASWAQGIVARGRGLWVEDGASHTLARATIVRWRRHLETCFTRELSPDAREIVTPLVTGDRTGLDPDLGAVFRSSGLVHLLALSGLHVVWMAGVARGITGALGGGLRARAWTGAACALFYVAIAGPLPSLARAAATEALAAVASLRGRLLDPLQALALATIVLLAATPSWAADLGFQLSCAATLGLTTLARRAGEWLERKPTIGASTLKLFVPTAAAQVTALPIVLDRFHALPWTALGSNLVAVPVCDLLMASAWLGAGLEALIPGAGRWCFAACEPLSRVLIGVAQAGAAAPRALWATGHSFGPPFLAGLGAALFVIACLDARDLVHARLPASRTRVALSWMGPLALLLAIVLGASAPAMRPPPGRWWLVVLDVGQGDALAIGGANGWRLVDCGPRSPGYDAGAGAVVPFLHWAAVRRLDDVILTHEHGDHIGGVTAVRRAVPVVRWWRGGSPRRRGTPDEAQDVHAGDTLGLEPMLVARWPAAGFASRDLNAGSLTLEAGEGEGRALLAADIDSTIEDRVIVGGRCAVLKVAHHGAAASSGRRFLERVRPQWAIVSCGARNPFGHPDVRTLARLATCGAQVRRTDQVGTVWLELGPDGVTEIDWRRDAVRETHRAPSPVVTGGALAHAPARC
ncbi:MAG TPA: DNA internalization-related competence protein ComEC/Rec2 [Candidatus Eisenbacteria bacterium]|nr:DNA internalization-related competence protein ComEC/Rec2 [Candidatus Eisenbacteria bacterium]